MHSSQLVPTYVSNGRLGPDNVSPNGWTSNSDVIVSDVAKDVQPTAKVQGSGNHPVTSAIFPDRITLSQEGSDTEMGIAFEADSAEKMTLGADSIGSFETAAARQQQTTTLKDVSHTAMNTPSRPRRATSSRKAAASASGQTGYQMCPCAANSEDEIMVQCEGCAVWYHIPCAGYLQEPDLPEKYECIICRLQTSGQVSTEKLEEVRNYLPTLTLERRALKKMYKKKKFENLHNMQREVGCDINDFRNLLARFEDMGFLEQKVTQVSRKINAKTRRTIQVKTFYTKNDSETMERYSAYFKPGGILELRACGISEATTVRWNKIDQMAEPKAVIPETAVLAVEKENIDPNIRSLVGTHAPKIIALPKPSRTAKAIPLPRPNARAVVEQDPPRTEASREIIALPKSNPRVAAAKLTTAAENATSQGLFRTAASIVVQNIETEEMGVKTSGEMNGFEEVTSATQAAVHKASVPEEDVDMGF